MALLEDADLIVAEVYSAQVSGAFDLEDIQSVSMDIDGFDVGGKVLLVAGVASDGLRIIQADDKLGTAAQVAGGWAAADAAEESVAPSARWFGPVGWIVDVYCKTF